jgi:hypothetical protein
VNRGKNATRRSVSSRRARSCCRPEDDEWFDERSEQFEAAGRALLSTPAPFPCYFWTKWEALDRIISHDAFDTRYTDCRAVFAHGAIKADMLRFVDTTAKWHANATCGVAAGARAVRAGLARLTGF